jgi:hypothetical protein
MRVLSALVATVDAFPGCRRPTTDSATLGRASGFAVVTQTRKSTQPPYEIHECQRCGLMYRTPRPPNTELEAYYRSDAFDSFESAHPFPTERAVSEILYRLPRAARILGFGCNTGRLRATLVGLFDCFGIELNATAANVARGRGLRITDLAELAAATGTFDGS